MGWRTKYDIGYKGLGEGLHEFEYEIEDTFFEHFDQGLADAGQINVRIGLEKRNTFLKLFFSLSGWVELTCDRCLEKYQQDIKNKAEIFVKFGKSPEEDDDEVMWVLPEEHKINVAQLIYEYTVLSIPMKRVHPGRKNGATGCNTEMIKRLEKYRPKPGKNKKSHAIDPRWEALKKIRNSE